MMLPPASIRRRSGFSQASHHAFTLIELLAVMVIILILAGLILNIAGNAQYKAAFSRATAEIKQMETACESYKVDNGTYPQGNAYGTNTTPPAATSTDTLNAQQNTDPTAAVYLSACEYLYQQLSGNTQPGTNSAYAKTYITFLPSQLSTGTATPTAATYLVDPFGLCYGYSTANAYAVANGNTTTTQGYNPTFDLWSTGGYSPSSGKAYPTSIPAGSTAATFYPTLWAKNW